MENAMQYLHQAATKIDAIGWARQSVRQLLAHQLQDDAGFRRVVENLLPNFDQS
jgi:virulence-associated protein VapD